MDRQINAAVIKPLHSYTNPEIFGEDPFSSFISSEVDH